MDVVSGVSTNDAAWRYFWWATLVDVHWARALCYSFSGWLGGVSTNLTAWDIFFSVSLGRGGPTVDVS